MKRTGGLAALAVAALALAGCSGGTADAAGSGSGEAVTIDFYQTYPVGGMGGPAITALVDRFNSSQSAIRVNQVNVAADQQMAQMQAEFASGDGPDVALVYYQYLEYIASNLPYVDPQQLLDGSDDPADETWLADTYDDSILATTRSESGEQIGFPYELSSAILFTNDSLLAQAGVDPASLATWEGVRAAAEQIKDTTGKAGLYINEGGSYTWEAQGIIESNGGSYFEGTEATIDSPETAQAYRFYDDMIYTDRSALHTASSDGLGAFIAGEVGMTLQSIIFTNSITSGAGFEMSPHPAPAFEGKPKSVPIGGDFLLVTAQDEAQRQASLEFVQYMLEPANLEAFIGTLGFAPATRPAAESSPSLAANEFTQVGYQQLIDQDQASRWASFPGRNGLQADQRMAELRDEILSRSMPIEEALAKGQAELNELLDG